MAFFGLFGKKKLNHDLSDEERLMGQEVRRMNQEKRRLQHQIELAEKNLDLAKLNDELFKYDDDEDDGIDSMVMNIIKDKLLGGVGLNATPPTSNTPSVALSDDAIEELISKLPKSYTTAAKGMSDETLSSILKSKTQYDDETIARIIQHFRAKNL